MPSLPQRNVKKTIKPYTVVFGAYDPPTPVVYANTSNERTARKIFESWRDLQIQMHREAGGIGTGGEWGLRLYKHTPASTLRALKTDDGDIYSDHPFVYDLWYDHSEVLEEFNYGDLWDVDKDIVELSPEN